MPTTARTTDIQEEQKAEKVKFTSRNLSMAGTGYSMMKRRKEYSPAQDTMNGPYGEINYLDERNGLVFL